MSLIRWNPGVQHDIARVHDEMDRLLDQFFVRPTPRNGFAAFVPAIDIVESPEEFVLRADLPGISQKDVKVSVMADTLTIRGERKQTTAQKDGSLHRSERVYGAFERSFTLGTPVRADQIKASYRDGVLEVHVPKAEEARMREIEVQVA